LGVGWALGVGCWMLGVGCWVRGRVAPGVRRLKGRWVALPPPVSRRPGWYTSPDLAAAPHLAAAAAPRGEGTRATSRRLPPKHPAGSQHPPYRKIPRSGRKIFGRWVFDIGRWVSPTDLGCWVARTTCWVLGVGRWMPLAKALGGVGGPRGATARWEHKCRSLARSRRQQGRLGLERSTGEVQVTRDPEVCNRVVRTSGHFHQQPTPKQGRRRQGGLQVPDRGDDDVGIILGA
jgi:hypothetical protein